MQRRIDLEASLAELDGRGDDLLEREPTVACQRGQPGIGSAWHDGTTRADRDLAALFSLKTSMVALFPQHPRPLIERNSPVAL